MRADLTRQSTVALWQSHNHSARGPLAQIPQKVLSTPRNSSSSSRGEVILVSPWFVVDLMGKRKEMDPAVPAVPGSKGAQVSPAVNWCFTWHSYPDDWIEQLNKQTLLSGFCVGRETCPSTDRAHLQGWVQFEKKGRPFSLELSPLVSKWFKCKGSPAANYAYCTKEDPNPVVTGTCLKHKPKVPFTVPLAEPRPWQRDLLTILRTEPDDRTVYWVWGPVGKIGKTRFCRHVITCMRDKHPLLLGGKAADMKCCIAEYLEKVKEDPRIILCNLPRSVNDQYIFYTGLEEVKDMTFFSRKFKSGMVVGPHPHLMIFANRPPDRSELSADRWVVFQVVDQELVESTE